MHCSVQWKVCECLSQVRFCQRKIELRFKPISNLFGHLVVAIVSNLICVPTLWLRRLFAHIVVALLFVLAQYGRLHFVVQTERQKRQWTKLKLFSQVHSFCNYVSFNKVGTRKILIYFVQRNFTVSTNRIKTLQFSFDRILVFNFCRVNTLF